MPNSKYQRYKPRNVINAPDVKAAIEQRSVQRNDNIELQRWLISHFYRWVISDFAFALTVNSPSDYTAYFGSSAVLPAWLLRYFENNKITNENNLLYYIDVWHPQLIAKESELVEFISRLRGTKLEKKIQRLNCYAAIAMREAEHSKMQHLHRKG